MSQTLPFEEIKFRRNVCLEDIINTPDDSDIAYLLKVDLICPHYIRQNT